MSKKADALVIAATNKNLVKLVQQAKFREDLFYRIQVIEITMPPLRNRREDIRLLVEHIFALQNAEDKSDNLPEQLREMFYHYDWPGNVRELTNTIQRYLATDDVILPDPTQMKSQNNGQKTIELHDAVEMLERKMIRAALQQTQWHRSAAARLLNIPRRTLQRKMQKYDLSET